MPAFYWLQTTPYKNGEFHAAKMIFRKCFKHDDTDKLSF